MKYSHFRLRVLLPALVAAGALFSPASVHADAADKAWGTIKGQAVFAGDAIPEPQQLDGVKMHPDKAHCLSKGPLLSDEWIINKKNRGVRWVLVWLQTEEEKAPPIHPSLQKPPTEPVTVDQPCCMFTPHAVVVREGQDLLVKNSSPIPHSIKWFSFKNPGGNLTIAAAGTHTIKELHADKIPVKLECALHAWMGGYAKVADHPYAAVTDEDGKFEIKLAPAGEFRLVTYHRKWGPAGRKGQKIVIDAGGVLDVGKIELRAD
ncbi:MAG TPA: hypothetical protein VGY66_18425 [Gemmataceae bacterium]|nr:hypothetical protein [Gemmataceae bacterium]